MQFKQKRIAAVVSLALALAAGGANAALERVGPISAAPTVGGFPSWYQDKSGLTLEFCDLMNQAELNGGWCTLIPPGPPTAPESFPDNFFTEHFYWDSTNVSTHQNGTKVRFIMAIEASFVNGVIPVPGQQVTFGRLRIVVNPLPASGTYTIYHPYGVWVFDNLNAGDRLFYTEDIGIGCPGTFDCTLGTSIGPFLLPSATSGGAEVPPIPDILPGQDPWYDILVTGGGSTAYPGTGKKYIADPSRIGPVTGSPLPPFLGNDGLMHDHNTLRIEGPGGFVVDQPNNFTLNGRVMSGQVPGLVNVDRASYGVSAAGNKVDVFAKAFETTPSRLPASPPTTPVIPILSYYDAACGGAITIDPVTGFPVINPPPYTAPVGFLSNAMANAGSNFWGQSLPAAIPGYVCVEDATARDAAGNVLPAFYLRRVVDDVAISASFYNGPAGGNLSVSATSSDPAATLTLAGFGPGGTGLDLVAGTATVVGISAPPAKVQVVSSQGGSIELPVTTAVGPANIGGVPVAVADAVTMFEDCSATSAVSCATPQIISPLANDTLNGAPMPPGGGTVTITQAPRLGTAVVNLDGTISYTPNANVFGIDSIAYTVTSGANVSSPANIAITITPVNDVPVAIADNAGALRGVANSVRVLANDFDADGAADLNNAVVVTGNANLGITAGTVWAGGVVTFTPPATTPAGPYTFTYNAVDISGAVSVNPATVTVSVSTAEAIVPAKTIYTSKTGRWTLSGTDSPAAGQTLTMKYANGTYKVNGACTGLAAGTVVASAVVDNLGNWLYDQILPSTVTILNPTNTANAAGGFWCSPPSSIVITSSLSPATANPPIQIK